MRGLVIEDGFEYTETLRHVWSKAQLGLVRGLQRVQRVQESPG